MLPKNLKHKLDKRQNENALRQLGKPHQSVDFSSNDYLGFASSEVIFNKVHQYLIDNNLTQNGATGSRLLSGNYNLYDAVERMLCDVHNSEAALVFNSGYTANIGFFSCVPQRGDIILYDEFIHASIRDGIGMSHAKAYKFKHNDLKDLTCHFERSRKVSENSEIYVITESVFSMDGDSPDLKSLSQLCDDNNTHLIIDEAHALGVFGDKGCGLVQELQLNAKVFARIITFGKALGCHGAAVLGSQQLIDFLINFSRPFIYTTGLPPHALATIKVSYNEMQSDSENYQKIQHNIQHFKTEIKRLQLDFIESDSAIQCCVLSGNTTVKRISKALYNDGFDVKPILSPTVPEGQERLRFCLHAYNSESEITEVLQLLATFVTHDNK